ncbi:hypothetical protein VCUG_02236 [Vavraia culicis subsp. floridensis]|uniref:MRG domain-containing protein n=1 Tax=Vavraia culicis (isolate floridensis) TaxID=948595 RepID=L2GRK5_VAVCU|nr:uncharacterized protein VCUG_02236 [Vavraia culicis subsp. floridensis]ELA46269.2 hypothetical protein VCUG_02236 [Vavraia culicis subsp. floridensis]
MSAHSMSDQFNVNNYVYKKINEEWLECRVTSVQNDLYGLYVLKTLSNLNVPADDTQIFPSTIETIRKFKISMVRYNNGFLYMPTVLKAKMVEDYERAMIGNRGGRGLAVEENVDEDEVDLLIGEKQTGGRDGDWIEEGESGRNDDRLEKGQSLKNGTDGMKDDENARSDIQGLENEVDKKNIQNDTEMNALVADEVIVGNRNENTSIYSYTKPNKSINSNITEILEEFRSFMMVNKPTIYSEELEEFIKHVMLCFKILCYYTLFTAEEKKRYGKFDLEKQCNAYHLLRLLAYMHEVLLLDVEDAGAREICFEFYVYLVDFLFVSVDEYF